MDINQLFVWDEIKENLVTGLKNGFNFTGKTDRKAFIQYAIGGIPLILVLSWIAGFLRIPVLGFLVYLFILFVIISFVAIVFRRFNDLQVKPHRYVVICAAIVVAFVGLEFLSGVLPRDVASVLEGGLFIAWLLSIFIPVRICLRNPEKEKTL